MRPIVLLYLAVMIALIVGLDIMLLKHHFWARLTVNGGIVLIFAAFYFWFLRRP